MSDGSPAVSGDFVLTTKELTRDFGAVRAVDHLSIAVKRGEIFGLLGPNGAGKTTLIKMLTTLLPPTSGAATVAGFDVQRQSSNVRRSIGYVPQLLSADGGLTGYENLMLSAKLYDVPREERRQRIEEFLQAMGLTDAADRLVRHYSGGMVRRLEIAQAMIHRPDVLFLDEPTVGLDPSARQSLWETLQTLSTNRSATIVLTTHYMEEADALCDRIAIMSRGRVAVSGAPNILKSALGNGSTLDDVFAHYTDASPETSGNLREISKTRRTLKRLG